MKKKYNQIYKVAFGFITLFLFYQVAFSQDTPPSVILVCGDDRPIVHEWLGASSRILTFDMELHYQRPEGFEEIVERECFDNNFLLSRTFGCSFSQLHSESGEFVSFLNFFPIFIGEWVDRQHSRQMRAIYNIFHHHLQYNQGRDSSQWRRWWGNSDSFQLDWRESAHFFSPEETRTKFNADTAAFFTLTLPPEYYFQGRFRYVDVFLLQKMGRGYVYFVSFYTEKAKRNIDWYRRRLWGSLRYED